MHISINTAEEISDLDRQVLGLLAGGSFILNGQPQEFTEEQDSAEEPETVEEEPEKPARRTRKKAEPEPEPEEMAEEPVEEDADEAGEDDYDVMDDEDLLALAIKKATEMVSGGEAAQVREALDAAGASRVRELNADNVREFFKALS